MEIGFVYRLRLEAQLHFDSPPGTLCAFRTAANPCAGLEPRTGAPQTIHRPVPRGSHAQNRKDAPRRQSRPRAPGARSRPLRPVSHAPDSDSWWNTIKNAIKEADQDFGVHTDYRNPPSGDLADMARIVEQ